MTYNGYTGEHALEIAAGLEAHSSHPIAHTFTPHFKYEAQDIENILGKGLSGFYKLNQDEPKEVLYEPEKKYL